MHCVVLKMEFKNHKTRNHVKSQVLKLNRARGSLSIMAGGNDDKWREPLMCDQNKGTCVCVQ